jgi:TatA/E family protein of Tat protein translocase
MFGVGWTEILVILVVALLVLGPNKLPEIAKGLGKGIRDFRKAMTSLDDDPHAPAPGATGTPPMATALPPPPPGNVVQTTFLAAGPAVAAPPVETPAKPLAEASDSRKSPT